MNDREYIEGRLEDQITYYDRSSVRNKRRYVLFKTMEIAWSASIPALLGVSELLDSTTCFPSILRGLAAVGGAVIAVIWGLEKVLNYQENSRTYRTTCEMLRREKYFYETHCGPYRGAENGLALLVQRVEDQIAGENMSWQQLMKEKQSQDGKAGAQVTAG